MPPYSMKPFFSNKPSRTRRASCEMSHKLSASRSRTIRINRRTSALIISTSWTSITGRVKPRSNMFASAVTSSPSLSRMLLSPAILLLPLCAISVLLNLPASTTQNECCDCWRCRDDCKRLTPKAYAQRTSTAMKALYVRWRGCNDFFGCADVCA